VDEQKNQRNHQPDDGQSKGEAGENLFHGLFSTINHLRWGQSPCGEADIALGSSCFPVHAARARHGWESQ